jgi:membrane-associated phospholipid phosphatase
MMPQSSPTDPEMLRAGARLVWTIIAIMGGTVVVAYWAVGLSVDFHSLPSLALVLPLCAAISLFYRFVRPDLGIVCCAESIAQILLIGFLGALLSYAAATLGLPYHDAALIAADRALGFDLGAYIQFLNARPLTALAYVIAYLSMMWQPAIVFVVLALSHRLERLHDFAIALAASLAVTIVIFALYPALGWYGAMHVDEAAFPRLQLFWNFAEHLDGVRSGALPAVPLGDLRGIISFPSYHTAAAVLAIWAIWPVRFIRWPMLALNGLMIAAAPVEGAHYLTDVIGGAVVGVIAIVIARETRRVLRQRLVATTRRGHGATAPMPALSITAA